MFHRAINLQFKKGTTLELTFQDGLIKQYDMAALFNKHPQLKVLKKRSLFLSGKLLGPYGVVWNDELDIEAETIYQEGVTVGRIETPVELRVGNAVAEARAKKKMTQVQLSDLCGIDQSDLSKIERGAYNPSVATLQRIADALDCRVEVKFVKCSN